MLSEVFLNGRVRKNDLLKIGDEIYIARGCKKTKTGYRVSIKPFKANDLYSIADPEIIRQSLNEKDLIPL